VRNNNGNFRFQGRRALLTYSCVGNFFAANDLALAIIPIIAVHATADFKWKWAIEQHHNDMVYNNDMEEGSWHVHVVFDLGRSCTERGAIFDINSIHPNLKPCGGRMQWKNCLCYLEKDGWFKTNIDNELDEELDSKPVGNVFTDALHAMSKEDFLGVIKDGAPLQFCMSYISIRACANYLYQQPPKQWVSEEHWPTSTTSHGTCQYTPTTSSATKSSNVLRG
jgi:hypothetical protein